jgi:polysaccharide export outer membrane protein
MNHKIVLGVMLLALIAALSCAGWAQATNPATSSASPSADTGTAPSEPQFSQRYPRYRVAPDDIMDVSFTFSPELNQTVTVQPDGFINLKEVGDIHVQDRTTTEVAELVHKAYANILHDPAITVVLKDFNKPSFIVGGEVHRPGKYDLRENMSVVQAVAVAGGFTEAAKHSEVWLYRRRPDDSVEVKKLNVKKMLAKGNLREDIRLQNGDTLFVPQNTFSKIKGVVSPRSSVALTTRP